MRQVRLSLVILAVPLICCGTPLLVAAVLVTGVGAWLAANRVFVGSAAALAVSVIAVGFWIQQRRRMR